MFLQVAAMREDLMRLVGRPVLEIFAERRAEILRRHSALREKVYIPIEGVRGGDDGKFAVSNDNPSFDLMDEVDTAFLQNDQKSVLLLAGPAGASRAHFVAGHLLTSLLQQAR